MTGTVMNMREYGLEPDVSGKVRDIFDLGDRLLIVATDRISAYDVILPDPIPGKGILLNQMTLGWYELFGHDLATHFITADHDTYPEPFKSRKELAGRSMLVKKAKRYDVECVVRGYLAGSGWREYKQNQRVCGIELSADLVESSPLEPPIFTPATKAESGHDENITFEQMTKIVEAAVAAQLRDLSFRIYERAHGYARDRGIILADTKFEFGEVDGEIILIDELLSPDSSRFWPLDTYAPGKSQFSFDKQFVRDYLDEIGWDHKPPGPRLPSHITKKTAERYREACKSLFPTIDTESFL
ncbi:MAG: phosphoribosylaminoimidazolesuccinocarboxamide synthase [Candidatus Krumholzibacteria bacterium]|nr:phosphoribosylaminoimidazolesuccinocarboxamide synthase [Candidatus Krumholzibacteria bacterium]